MSNSRLAEKMGRTTKLDFCRFVMVMLRGIGDPAAGFVILAVVFSDPHDRKAFQK